MLISPNKDETAVHGCHCRGDMVLRMRKVLAELVCVLWLVPSRYVKRVSFVDRRYTKGFPGVILHTFIVSLLIILWGSN